jgi:hypothetical protein
MRNRNKESDEQLYERFGNFLERRDVELRIVRLAEAHRRALADPRSRFTHLPPRATWRKEHDANATDDRPASD